MNEVSVRWERLSVCVVWVNSQSRSSIFISWSQKWIQFSLRVDPHFSKLSENFNEYIWVLIRIYTKEFLLNDEFLISRGKPFHSSLHCVQSHSIGTMFWQSLLRSSRLRHWENISFQSIQRLNRGLENQNEVSTIFTELDHMHFKSNHLHFRITHQSILSTMIQEK